MARTGRRDSIASSYIVPGGVGFRCNFSKKSVVLLVFVIVLVLVIECGSFDYEHEYDYEHE